MKIGKMTFAAPNIGNMEFCDLELSTEELFRILEGLGVKSPEPKPSEVKNS